MNVLRLDFIAVMLIVCFACKAQEPAERQMAGYPHGPDALPLLREVWTFNAENIYPAGLADRFDDMTLTRFEENLRSSDDAALADILNPFLDSLGVSHTRFYDRRHQAYYLLRSLFATSEIDAPKLHTIGVHLDDDEPGLILSVMEGSPAAAGGVRRGEKIVAVDGLAFRSLLQWQRDGPVRLTIENQSRQREIALEPVRQSFHRALAEATIASRRVMDCEGRRIGYLHLWSGTHEVFLNTLNDAVLSAVDAGLDGFVLDLRDGYGGAWYPYLDPFFPNREDYFVATTFSRDGQFALTAEPQDNSRAWNGPLAVIINGGTRSGKESLAYQFSKSGRARLFGSTTSGAFTGGLGAFVEREEDFVLYLSVSETKLDGTAIEGTGVSPDTRVPDDPYHDAPLAAALNHLGCNKLQ